MHEDADMIDVWLDHPCARLRDVEQYYSISLVDDIGDEIACVGGSTSLIEAWDEAKELADELGIPAVEHASDSGEETDRYTPRFRGER